MSGATLAEAVTRHGHKETVHARDLAEAGRMVRARVQPGDLLITLGAGDVWKVGEQFLKEAS